jgi:pimeloyl-ACP methyl ester carboxylesterase
MGPTSPRDTVTDARAARSSSWLAEAFRLYPGFYRAKLGPRLAQPPLTPGAAGAIVVPGWFASIKVYGLLMERVRARGVPIVALDCGLNVAGPLAWRIEALRAASGGRVVLVGHSMGTLVSARYLLDRPRGVSGFVSICGVFGGLRSWTRLGWPLFPCVREMWRETGSCLPAAMRSLLKDPPVPTTIFQADRDEFVCDQSGFADVIRFPTSVTHNGPVRDAQAVDAIAARVAEYASRGTLIP